MLANHSKLWTSRVSLAVAHPDRPPLGGNTIYVSAAKALLPLEKDECAPMKTISRELKASLCSTKLASQSTEVTEESPTDQNHSETGLAMSGKRKCDQPQSPASCPLLWTHTEIIQCVFTRADEYLFLLGI